MTVRRNVAIAIAVDVMLSNIQIRAVAEYRTVNSNDEKGRSAAAPP
jgi:hypothetical protein